MRKFALSLLAMAAFAVQAQNVNTSKFRQLGQELPTPNVYRTASCSPKQRHSLQKLSLQFYTSLNTHGGGIRVRPVSLPYRKTRRVS